MLGTVYAHMREHVPHLSVTAQAQCASWCRSIPLSLVDVFIAHHHMAMSFQQRPICIVSTTPSLSRPFYSFITSKKRRRPLLLLLRFACLPTPRLPLAHPFPSLHSMPSLLSLPRVLRDSLDMTSALRWDKKSYRDFWSLT